MKGQDHECHIEECVNYARSIIAGRKWCDACLRAYRLGRFEMADRIIRQVNEDKTEEQYVNQLPKEKK